MLSLLIHSVPSILLLRPSKFITVVSHVIDHNFGKPTFSKWSPLYCILHACAFMAGALNRLWGTIGQMHKWCAQEEIMTLNVKTYFHFWNSSEKCSTLCSDVVQKPNIERGVRGWWKDRLIDSHYKRESYKSSGDEGKFLNVEIYSYAVFLTGKQSLQMDDLLCSERLLPSHRMNQRKSVRALFVAILWNIAEMDPIRVLQRLWSI